MVGGPYALKGKHREVGVLVCLSYTQRCLCPKIGVLLPLGFNPPAVNILRRMADKMLEQVVTPERAYTADGNDRFLGNFEFGIATKFIDDLRTNVKRGNRARFQQGWPNYRPPIGYIEDRATKTVIKDPERFDLRTPGKSGCADEGPGRRDTRGRDAPHPTTSQPGC